LKSKPWNAFLFLFFEGAGHCDSSSSSEAAIKKRLVIELGCQIESKHSSALQLADT
jgi:hypothetical protein